MKDIAQQTYTERRSYFTRESFFTAKDVLVDIKNAGYGDITIRGHSLTDDGLSVDFGLNIRPPIGTEFQARIKRHTGFINKQWVPMRITAEHPDGEYELVFVH